MKRARPYRTAILLVGLVVSGFISLAACSDQGEGERCELLNGHDDCKAGLGLICVAATDLTNTTSDRCCPQDRSTATAPVCKTPINIVSGDATAPTDSGPIPADATVRDSGTAAADAADAATE